MMRCKSNDLVNSYDNGHESLRIKHIHIVYMEPSIEPWKLGPIINYFEDFKFI